MPNTQPTQSNCLVASIQLNSQNNLDSNQAIIKRAIAQASQQGARLIVLPENACYMGKQADIAQRFDELSAWFGTLAKQHHVHLIAGTLPCPYRRDGSPIGHDKFFQTSLAFDPQGNIIARYDKIHLFCAYVNDGVGYYDESATFDTGKEIVFADCMIDGQKVRVGMMVCFDLRFARLAQSLRQMGADILVAPSAFTFKTGQAHWQLLLQARALDSQCMVIGAAQGGRHQTANSERQTWGHSAIIAADGTILANTNTSATNEDFLVAYATFDPKAQQKTRQALPIFDCHRLA